MSVRKQKQLAEEKAAVDRQTHAINQKFRMNRINKAFGQLSGEELFKPITKRLDSAATAEEGNPDYAMDEFDRTNPFGEEFRPDSPTPAPPPTPPPYQGVDDDVDDLSPPPPLMEEKSARKEWGAPGPVVPEYPHESTLLQRVNSLITKLRNDPNYRVKSEKSPLHGYSVEDLKKVRDGIYAKRSITSKQLQEGSQRLIPSRARPAKEAPPPSPLERAVMSRRPIVEPSDDDEEDFPEQDWETEGSGVAGGLIDRLYVSFGSIRAGNSSIKLRQVLSLLDSLVRVGAINIEQNKKIIHDYIDPNNAVVQSSA